MDGRTTAAVACVVAGSAWLAFAFVLLLRRVRFSQRARRGEPAPAVQLPPARTAEYGWLDPGSGHGVVRAGVAAGVGDHESRIRLRRALASPDPAVRRAAVTALGRLGERHDWAIDGLIEALAEGRDTPARVAAELDRLAPRVGARVVPLLGHPASVVRFYGVRLLARHGEGVRELAAGLVRDPSPNVRAGALETLRTVATGDALRCALELLDDPHPHVRAHACRTACSISGAAAAPLVVPLLADASWRVRDAARASLVAVGRDVTPAVLPALDDDDARVRSDAALVLQDVGVVDELLGSGSDAGLLERIFAAGGERLRAAATERAHRGLTVRRGPRPLPSGAAP